MEFTISLIALLLSWLFIEIFISIFFLTSKKNLNFHIFSLKHFKIALRSLIIILFTLIIIYMYFFQTEELKKIVNLCIGFIK